MAFEDSFNKDLTLFQTPIHQPTHAHTGVRVGAGFRLGNNDDGEWYAIVVQGGKEKRAKKEVTWASGHGKGRGPETERGLRKKSGDMSAIEEVECVVRIEFRLRAPEPAPKVSVSILYAPPKSHARHRLAKMHERNTSSSIMHTHVHTDTHTHMHTCTRTRRMMQPKSLGCCARVVMDAAPA